MVHGQRKQTVLRRGSIFREIPFPWKRIVYTGSFDVSKYLIFRLRSYYFFAFVYLADTCYRRNFDSNQNNFVQQVNQQFVRTTPLKIIKILLVFVCSWLSYQFPIRLLLLEILHINSYTQQKSFARKKDSGFWSFESISPKRQFPFCSKRMYSTFAVFFELGIKI